MVPVAAAVTADETEALKAEITKAVKQVQEAGEEEMGGGGACQPVPAPPPPLTPGSSSCRSHLSQPFFLQTPTPRSSTPAIPAGKNSWMLPAWHSMSASTRPKPLSCSRPTQTFTSNTELLLLGKQSRLFPPENSSSEPATAPPNPLLPPWPLHPQLGRVSPLQSDSPSPLFKRQLLGNGVKSVFLEGERWNKLQYFLMADARGGGGLGTAALF